MVVAAAAVVVVAVVVLWCPVMNFSRVCEAVWAARHAGTVLPVFVLHTEIQQDCFSNRCLVGGAKQAHESFVCILTVK